MTAARLRLLTVMRRVVVLLCKSYSPGERKELWKAVDRTARKWEPRFTAGAADAFDDNRRDILAIVSGGNKASLARKASVDWEEIGSDIADYLKGLGDEIWRKTFAPLVAGVMGEQGKQWAVKLGVRFDVQNLAARDWFNEYMLKFAQPINDTTEREIAQIMNRAQQEGSSVPTIQKQLDALFNRYISGMSPDDPEFEWYTDRTPPQRTEMIARTETIRASNSGSNELFREWGVKRKEWLSTKDDRTRSYAKGDEFDHVEVDGQVVGIDEKFTVSGEQLEYPLDPSGSPGNIIQCRCTELPVIEDEPLGEQEEER